MEDLIPISHLNDFLFCPYSIYLHSVYGAAEEEICKAVPQKAGIYAHENVSKKTATGIIRNIPIRSEKLGIYGKIDELDTVTGTMSEYKNRLPSIFPGQKMQLYGEFFCLQEMGMTVRNIQLVEIQPGKLFPLPVPGQDEKDSLTALIERIKTYDPAREIPVNRNKCLKCIYCTLCEKTDSDNVF